MFFAEGADLNYRSLPDYSDLAFPLLEEALRQKILDPNGRVNGPTYRDLSGQPVFTYYYRVRIASYRIISTRDWKLLQLLVHNGADLTLDEAKPLLEDLRRKLSPEPSGNYMRLDQNGADAVMSVG